MVYSSVYLYIFQLYKISATKSRMGLDETQEEVFLNARSVLERKKCNGVMHLRLLLGLCLARCVSCTQPHQPEDVLDAGGLLAQPIGLRAQLTCSEIGSEVMRTEVQLRALQRQVDALKHVRDEVSQRLHLCEAQAGIGATNSSSPGETASDSHQTRRAF